ncbi:MAG: hypothetical protein M5U05_14260 [Anaerolineales bacterium]|nr:hypothetical protein [Anaerolineales bacterium]
MKRQFNRLLLFLLTVPVLLFIYLPVFYMVLSSISTRSELLSTPIHWIPQNPTLKNYIDILTPGTTTSEVAKTFKLTLRNSLIVATSVTIISLTLELDGGVRPIADAHPLSQRDSDRHHGDAHDP